VCLGQGTQILRPNSVSSFVTEYLSKKTQKNQSKNNKLATN
jgi:hypothetical protein